MPNRKGLALEKSFASNEKAKFWSAKNKVRPEEITIRSGKKYIFDCDNPECGHEFITSPDKIASGTWCNYCCIPSNTLCEDMNCSKCLVKTFVGHEKAQYWSDKNELPPNRVFMN